MSFADEFKHETPILHAALEAAVGPLPEAELLGLGRIRVGGVESAQPTRYFDPHPGVILAEARVLLAAYVQACRTLVKVESVGHDAEGIHVTGYVPDFDVARYLVGDPIHASIDTSRLEAAGLILDGATPADCICGHPEAKHHPTRTEGWCISGIATGHGCRCKAYTADDLPPHVETITPDLTGLRGEASRPPDDATPYLVTPITKDAAAQVRLSPHYLAQLLENDPDLEDADLHGMLTRAILVGRGEVIYATDLPPLAQGGEVPRG